MVAASVGKEGLKWSIRGVDEGEFKKYLKPQSTRSLLKARKFSSWRISNSVGWEPERVTEN